MNRSWHGRREFLKRAAAVAAWAALRRAGIAADGAVKLDPALERDWLARWEKNILSDGKNRYCDREMGEELGWLVSPFLNGFYYGYRATGDAQWLERLADWTQSWTARGLKEPDGFTGWPKSGSGGMVEDSVYSDSLLGEAMALRPAILAARDILRDAALKEKFGQRARAWLKLAESTFDKWVSRDCWREVKEGGVWVVPAFGLDGKTGQWTENYVRRATEGFSNPDNKQNLIALWLLALHEATGKPAYRAHAEKWWRVMKSRLRTREDGKYLRLELLGTGRAVGFQGGRFAAALDRGPSQRRLLRGGRGGDGGSVRARVGFHAGGRGQADRDQSGFHVEQSSKRSPIPAH